MQKIYQYKVVHFLLIVPYGIETKEEVDYEIEQQLLIVPYGIETVLAMCRGLFTLYF